MIITYKKAKNKDIEQIRLIAEKTWFVTYEPILGKEQPKFMFDLIYSETALAEQMTNGQVFVLQFADNQIVAFASYSLKDEKESVYKLNKLYLDPTFQGGGYGKKLLSEVESQVKNLGGKILDLNVNRYNKARFFYEKVGFEIILEEDIPIGDYWMNDFVMRKILI
ncbi:GNAT family N-acetyltransferase [Emticicia sp. SJ17W-69]|uniref:GNAT family N-acetyltransferase n=1 Tax=Emticicia sp. SJ17W-69 TaxID=3421657 RepID=UPI003EBBEA23